jgi:hypothetical protein
VPALEWTQLEQLVDGGCWLPAKATVPPAVSGQQASVGLRNLRTRGLVEYTQDDETYVGRWQATTAGTALVMEARR